MHLALQGQKCRAAMSSAILPFMPIADLQHFRAIMEVLYFGSGVVIAFTALLALRHLKIGEETLAATKQQLALATASIEQARADMHIRSRREAVTLGAQLCERFADSVIPLGNSFCQLLDREKIQNFRWGLRDTHFNAKSIVDTEGAKRCYAALVASDDAHGLALHLLNDLEALAIYFVKGAADESTAFASIGETFCEMVEELAPCIVVAREIEGPAHRSGRYENTVELYSMWSDRIRHADLELQSTRVRTQIESIQPRQIQPLGIDDGA